jgi:hypothetical protein
MAGALVVGSINSVDVSAIQDQVATAWVNFNGTGTVSIQDSLNVSSITDTGSGSFTINFTEAMSSLNYGGCGSARKNDTNDDGNVNVQVGGYASSGKSTSSCPIRTTYSSSTTSIDFSETYVIFFGGK